MARKLASETRADALGQRTTAMGRRQYLSLSIPALIGAVAATGSAAGDTTDHDLRVEGHGQLSSYEITVDGGLEPDDDEEPIAETRISGNSAEGTITDTDRVYQYSGDVQYLAVKGNARIYVDGTQVVPIPSDVDAE